MGWIEEIAPIAAQGRLMDLSDDLERKRGKVSSFFAGAQPAAGGADAPGSVKGLDVRPPGWLSRRQREMITVV